MHVELNVAQGGHPDLKVVPTLLIDSEWDGSEHDAPDSPVALYLSVTGHYRTAGGKREDRNVFVGIRAEDIDAIQNALEVAREKVQT